MKNFLLAMVMLAVTASTCWAQPDPPGGGEQGYPNAETTSVVVETWWVHIYILRQRVHWTVECTCLVPGDLYLINGDVFHWGELPVETFMDAINDWPFMAAGETYRKTFTFDTHPDPATDDIPIPHGFNFNTNWMRFRVRFSGEDIIDQEHYSFFNLRLLGSRSP